MKVNKICGICKGGIAPKDNYVELIDYKLGKFFKRGYYHNHCYHDKLNNAISKNIKGVMDRLKDIKIDIAKEDDR